MSDKRCVLAPISLCLCLLALAAAEEREQTDQDRELELLWTDLEKDELLASRALLKLSATPENSVRFLASRLQRLKIKPERVRSLLVDLASGKDEVWKPAFDELSYFDPRLAIELEPLMNEVTESRTRQRLVAILSQRSVESLAGRDIELRKLRDDWYNFRSANASWGAEPKVQRIKCPKWTRAIRAIVLLEHIGSPAAVRILEEMVAGHPDAPPSIAAKDALRRIWDKQAQ